MPIQPIDNDVNKGGASTPSANEIKTLKKGIKIFIALAIIAALFAICALIF